MIKTPAQLDRYLRPIRYVRSLLVAWLIVQLVVDLRPCILIGSARPLSSLAQQYLVNCYAYLLLITIVLPNSLGISKGRAIACQNFPVRFWPVISLYRSSA